LTPFAFVLKVHRAFDITSDLPEFPELHSNSNGKLLVGPLGPLAARPNNDPALAQTFSRISMIRQYATLLRLGLPVFTSLGNCIRSPS